MVCRVDVYMSCCLCKGKLMESSRMIGNAPSVVQNRNCQRLRRVLLQPSSLKMVEKNFT